MNKNMWFVTIIAALGCVNLYGSYVGIGGDVRVTTSPARLADCQTQIDKAADDYRNHAGGSLGDIRRRYFRTQQERRSCCDAVRQDLANRHQRFTQEQKVVCYR